MCGPDGHTICSPPATAVVIGISWSRPVTFWLLRLITVLYCLRLICSASSKFVLGARLPILVHLPSTIYWPSDLDRWPFNCTSTRYVILRAYNVTIKSENDIWLSAHYYRGVGLSWILKRFARGGGEGTKTNLVTTISTSYWMTEESNKCLANAKRPCDCSVLCLRPKSPLWSCSHSIFRRDVIRQHCGDSSGSMHVDATTG